MFRKVYTQSLSYIRQGSIGGIEEHVSSYVILWPYPLSFKNAPKRFRDIQLWRVWRQVKQEKPSFLPYGAKLFYLLVSMYRGVVENHKSIHFQIERELIKKTDDLLCCHPLKCGESLVPIVTIYHSKDIQTCNPLGRNINILSRQLPTVRNVSFRTSVTLIGIIEPYASFRRLIFKFLRLIDLICIELRRGYSPWAFSYSLISCSNADKNV